MHDDAPTNRNHTIDPALVAAIAREVIARIKSTSKTNDTAASIGDRVVTAAAIERLTGQPTQVFITPQAIVTPAARDEARRRGIAINRTVQLPDSQRPDHAKLEITDSTNPERATAVQAQVARRGHADASARIVLSDTPAREVYQQCAVNGEIAVMITSVTDVQRFAQELSPTVWVLDMQRLNLTAAVNAVARILQNGAPTR